MPASPGEGVRPSTGGLGEATHLRHTTRHECGLGVVAEPQAVGSAGCERDDVLRGRAELDADDVVAHVDAEDRRVDRDLEEHRELEVVARDDRGGGKALDDLLGDVRPGEHSDRTVPHERGETSAGRGIEALREAEHGRRAGERAHDVAEDRARHGDHHEVGVRHRCVGQDFDRDPAEVCSGCVPGVAPALAHDRDLLRVARRER